MKFLTGCEEKKIKEIGLIIEKCWNTYIKNYGLGKEWAPDEFYKVVYKTIKYLPLPYSTFDFNFKTKTN